MVEEVEKSETGRLTPGSSFSPQQDQRDRQAQNRTREDVEADFKAAQCGSSAAPAHQAGQAVAHPSRQETPFGATKVSPALQRAPDVPPFRYPSRSAGHWRR
ncbi:hypothetical protein P7C73_g710, partial [Tremellales sp. Uapishka_1]